MTAAAGTAVRRVAADPQSLRGHLGAFATRRSPQLLTVVLAAAVTGRVLQGRVGVRDLVVLAAFVAAQPFVEWLIHVTVLHAKPKVVLGRRIDLLPARQHRAHHRDPKRVDMLLIDWRAIAVLAPLLAVVYYLAFDRRTDAVTAMAASTALTLAYEWTHYLIHTDYSPRSWIYRRVHRAHRLHHYKNERYWYGVTSTFADHVLRTFPDRDAVPTSPTARTLGQPAG